MRVSSRETILDAVVERLRRGHRLSRDAAAAAAGVTKPGLIYYFATKEALSLAVLDRVVDDSEREFLDRLGVPFEESSIEQRLEAYVAWTLSGEVDEARLVMLADVKFKHQMVQRFEPWLTIPDEVDGARRARLNAVRLMADGCWFADAMGSFALDGDERCALRRLAHDVLKGERP